jgi:AraC family L-rhamnose operon regulatory protein RhaS
MSLIREFFSSYLPRRAHPDLPLVLLRQHFPAGEHTGHHLHEDFFALYVVQGGRGLHIINDHAYPIKRGDVYMTAPGSSVAYAQYVDLRAAVLCFQADLFTDDERDALGSLTGFRDMFVLDPLRTRAADAAREYQLHLSPEQYRAVEGHVDGLFDEAARSEPVTPLLMRHALFRILVAVARARRPPAAAALAVPADAGLALADIIRVCEEHFSENLSVPQLAARMFLSPGHFTEIFTREVGMPPAAYLRRLRLERAQTLLRETTLPVTAVAMQVGFGDAAGLSRAFRGAFGLSPLQYRRRKRQNLP